MARHPGPKPQPFEFPFSEALRLRAAAKALADDIRVLVEQSQSALSHASIGFSGCTRVEVDADFGAVVTALWLLRLDLEEQAAALEGGFRRATAAGIERDARIAAWHRDLRAYREAQAAGARR